MLGGQPFEHLIQSDIGAFLGQSEADDLRRPVGPQPLHRFVVEGQQPSGVAEQDRPFAR